MLFFQLTRIIINSFGPWALGRHIRQTLSAHVITVMLLKSTVSSQVPEWHLLNVQSESTFNHVEYPKGFKINE